MLNLFGSIAVGIAAAKLAKAISTPKTKANIAPPKTFVSKLDRPILDSKDKYKVPANIPMYNRFKAFQKDQVKYNNVTRCNKESDHVFSFIKFPSGMYYIWFIRDLWNETNSMYAHVTPIDDIKPGYTTNVDPQRVKDASLSYPIIAHRNTKLIIDGRHRYMKAKQLGHDRIKVIWVDEPHYRTTTLELGAYDMQLN